MILSDTRIAGDLKIAEGKAIYASGRVTIPELAVLKSNTVANKPVLFPEEDSPSETIKATETLIENGTITSHSERNVSVGTATSLSIENSPEVTFSGVTKTKTADQSLVTVCQKRNATAPTWGTDDKVLVSGDICYVYSKSQKLSEYDLSTNQFVFLPKGSFTADTSQATSGHIFKLITDPTFSLA